MGKLLVGRVLGATALLVGLGLASKRANGGSGNTQHVSMVLPTLFNDPPPNTGTFTTTGPATDSGLICEHGTTVDTRIVFVGFQSDFQIQVLVLKNLVCDDGSGTMFFKMQVHGNFDGTETFNWVVQGGTGDYANLRGSGQGVSVPNETGNDSFWDGFLVG